MVGQVKIKDINACKFEHPFLLKDPARSNLTICAGSFGFTLCQGDFGGPLVCETEGQPDVLTGISTFTSSLCSRKVIWRQSGVFTNIGPYVGWIKLQMKNYESRTETENNSTRLTATFVFVGFLFWLKVV